jgi:hypothetical protein
MTRPLYELAEILIFAVSHNIAFGDRVEAAVCCNIPNASRNGSNDTMRPLYPIVYAKETFDSSP